MILGTGIDLVNIDEFARLITSRDVSFVKTHFCKSEQDYCESGLAGRNSHYAVRYAAKEACIKAMDQAFLFRDSPIKNLDYLSMEVAHDPQGRPYMILHNELKSCVENLNGKLYLSLSHDGAYAVAQVVLSCQD